MATTVKAHLKRKQALPIDMGSTILRLKTEGKRTHRYGNSVIPLEGGNEIYLHPRAGLVIRRQGRSGARITSSVARALHECKGSSDFISCVVSKVPGFEPYSWKKHKSL